MPVNGPPGGLCYPCRTLPRSRGPPGTGMAATGDVCLPANDAITGFSHLFDTYLAKL
jgi:hypothetical protein